jgi:hypothetical protein
MLTLTKQDSIVIAITLGLALGVPLSLPAFYTISNMTIEDRVAPSLHNCNPAEPPAKRRAFTGNVADSGWPSSGVDDDMCAGLPMEYPQMNRL